MSDQSLREAPCPDAEPHAAHDHKPRHAQSWARCLGRVAEPAPVVTDEAVEAAAKAVSLDWQNYVASMRRALEAAAPLLAWKLARPTPTREQIADVLREFGHEEDGGGWVLFADSLDDFAHAVLALLNGAES